MRAERSGGSYRGHFLSRGGDGRDRREQLASLDRGAFENAGRRNMLVHVRDFNATDHHAGEDREQVARDGIGDLAPCHALKHL